MKQKKGATNLLVFKRWTRKSYAAFSSMHKVVKIGVITLGCSFLSMPAKASNPQESDKNPMRSVELSPVEITADAMLQNETLQLNNLNASISKKQIQSLPVQSLSDILENLPGLDIRQRGPLNTQADISYRGGTFDQTVILLNGINFSDPQTGHYLLNLPFSPDIIQKINLFSNTTSYLFGTSPFSGLINIITAPRKENSISLHAMGGMFGLGTFSASLNLASKRYRQLITAGHERSDGYIKNTDFKHSYGFYHGIVGFDAGKLELQAGYTDRAYGANGFYSLKFPNQYDHTKTFITSIRYENKGTAVKVIPSAYYRYNSDSFELFRGTNNFRNDHINQTLGGNVRSFFDTRLGRTSASIDLRIEDVLSSNLGEKLDEPIPVKGSTELFYKYRKTRTTSGLSLSQAYSYKRFSANGTILLQQNWVPRNKKDELKTGFYPLPAIDLSYRYATAKIGTNEFDAKTTLSLASTMRMPTFTDLFYKQPGVLGNKALKPEKAKTIELANSFLFSNPQNSRKIADANINIFARFGENMIDYIKKEKTEDWRAINHGKITFVGANLATTIHPQALWGNKFILTQLSLSYDYLYSDQNSGDFQSRYVLDHLQHKFTSKLTHKIYRNIEAGWTISYNKRKGNYTDATSTLQAYKGFWLLDGRISYKYKQLKLYTEASNIFNVKYFDYGDLIQPGTWVRGGVTYKLNWN